MIEKCYRYLLKFKYIIEYLFVRLLMYLMNVEINGKIKIKGIPYIRKASNAKMIIKDGVKIISSITANPVGGDERMKFFVMGELFIDEKTGMSNTTIVCMDKIHIGKRVIIGGGTKIYDTDFHPIHYLDRIENPNNIKTSPILIDDDVFIGAHSIILKGVRIGKGSVIGAGSVVAKDIPANQIWAGNPVIYIKDIKSSQS